MPQHRQFLVAQAQGLGLQKAKGMLDAGPITAEEYEAKVQIFAEMQDGIV